jgi:hypothetical protein
VRLQEEQQSYCTNRAQELTNRKDGSHKIGQNLLKSKGIALQLCINAIQPSMNLFPKNHCLGLTQTSEKSDRSKNEKTFPKNENHSTSEERKSHAKMMNPGGQKEDLGLHSHTKSPQIHPQIFRFFDLSQN